MGFDFEAKSYSLLLPLIEKVMEKEEEVYLQPQDARLPILCVGRMKTAYYEEEGIEVYYLSIGYTRRLGKVCKIEVDHESERAHCTDIYDALIDRGNHEPPREDLFHLLDNVWRLGYLGEDAEKPDVYK